MFVPIDVFSNANGFVYYMTTQFFPQRPIFPETAAHKGGIQRVQGAQREQV